MLLEQVIRGNIEALDQGLTLVRSVSDEQYQKVVAPYASSSMGAHFRHILDMFFALKGPLDDDKKLNAAKQEPLNKGTDTFRVLIDYDHRRRGALIETERSQAINEIEEIKQWVKNLQSLCDHFGNFTVDVVTEVSLCDTQSVTVESNFLRELVFVSSHAVHHYALISLIAKLQNVELNDDIGLAPATVSFLRNLNTNKAKAS